jgi:pimeloyl-ACP methyl ester carboxylesterase
MMGRRRIWRRLVSGLLLGMVTAAVGFVVWAERAAPAMPEAQQALVSDARVTVDTEPWLIFAPATGRPAVGFVIYPGGRVDPAAYAPPARALAAEGFLTVIVPMPLHLAVLDPGAAADVLAAFPEVERWAVGGHSLGGAMAANFARRHPDRVDGLVLWASYPADSDDLSALDVRVVSVFGTQDGLTSLDQIEASRRLLPADTLFRAIEGGNHAQFGWYGAQPGDHPAGVTREEQQIQVLEATRALLNAMMEAAP